MSIRDALRKAAGLLVELPEEESRPTPGAKVVSGDDIDRRLAEVNRALKGLGASPDQPAKPQPQPRPAQTKTVEQIVRDAPGPNLDEIEVTAEAPAPQPDAGGKIDFGPVYRAAKLPETPFTAEQMLGILAGLPAELPLDVRRQTVQVTLGAMGKSIGATPETIVADASRKLAALAAYSESIAKDTAAFVSTSELEIADLQAKMEDKRKAIEAARAKQAQIAKHCTAESERLDDVLEFFSLDVAPSKYAAKEPPK